MDEIVPNGDDAVVPKSLAPSEKPQKSEPQEELEKLREEVERLDALYRRELLPDAGLDRLDYLRNKLSLKAAMSTPHETAAACDKCASDGYILQTRNGNVDADICTNCSRSGAGNLAGTISCAKIPAKYIGAAAANGDSLLDAGPLIFFYGKCGTGKTHRSIQVMMQAIRSQVAKRALYLTLNADLMTYRSLASAISFSHVKDNLEYEIHKLCLEIFDIDFVVIDEVGNGKKLSQEQEQILFDIVDKRYSKEKKTVIISNNSVNALKKQLGERIVSRLDAAVCQHFEGKEWRKEQGKIINVAADVEDFTKEEVDNFMVPAKILTHGDDEHTIMNWLARNPAFETVSTQRRKELTHTDPNGEESDKDRPEKTTVSNVWVHGDSLSLHGPVCDHEDKKLYAFLVKELVQKHRERHRGLMLELSFRHILRSLGANGSGKHIEILKRQLARLNRMNLTFTNIKGTRWSGPLLTTVYQKGEGRERRAFIEFNRYMITFYKLHEYITFSKEKSSELSGHSSAFYLFYSSHTIKEMSIGVKKCRELLAISPEMDNKSALKRIRESIKDLIDAGVMDPSKTYVKDGKVYTSLSAT